MLHCTIVELERPHAARPSQCLLPVANRPRANWHPEGAEASQFFNALSLFFPVGDRFLISSIRNYQSLVKAPNYSLPRRITHSCERAGLPAKKLENKESAAPTNFSQGVAGMVTKACLPLWLDSASASRFCTTLKANFESKSLSSIQ